LEDRHKLPVRSSVILLRPEANSPRLTGVYERRFPGEEAYQIFHYQVIRVWQLPSELLLTSGLALLPLAPISAVTESELPGIIKRNEQRLSSRQAQKQASAISAIWSATYILLGLRYSPIMAH